MKVLWLANIPSPYSVDFFNELGKLCDLTVLFELKGAKDRDSSWRIFNFETFCGVFLRGIQYSDDKALCPGVITYLDRKYDIIVASTMPTLTGMLAILHMQLKGIPYIIQGDGGFKKDGKGLKERLKYLLISKAKAWLSTGTAHDEYYLAYGAIKERLYRIPFTSLKEKDVAESIITPEKKRLMKRELGINPDRKMVLSVGQFIHRKGFDVLLHGAKRLDPMDEVYIVGGTPTEEYRRIINEENLENVTFMEFMAPDKLRKYYKCADLFVLPTREDIWGLVINEAIAQGLPVVTTSGCIAGQELVENGVNGCIVPVDEFELLSKAIDQILYSSKYDEYCINSLKKAKYYTIENTAAVHCQIFDRIVDQRE